MQTNHSVTWIALLLISMLSFTKINAQAPDWQWAKSGGSKGLDFIYASASDKSGNIYITGYFESDILKLGSYKLTHTLNSTRQVFIAKYDSTGNVLWAQTAGGTSNDEPSALTCDIDGNIYLLGYFSSPTISFGSYTLKLTNNQNMFLVKYSPNGTVVWAKCTQGNGDVALWGVAVDKNKNVYATGTYSGDTIIFDKIQIKSPSLNGNMFFTKYDSSGNALWVKTSIGDNYDFGGTVTVDTSGNIVIMGGYESDTINFDGLKLVNPKTGGDFMSNFIVKYDRYGNSIWAKSIGINDNEHDFMCSAKYDISGNLYVYGDFRDSAIFFDSIRLKRISNDDTYLAKLDENGHTIWAKSSKGTEYYTEAGCQTFDEAGNLLIIGNFSGSKIIFNTDTLYSKKTGSPPTYSIFIYLFDTAGNIKWAKGTGLNNGEDGISINPAPFGNIYISGNFYGQKASFGPYLLTNTDTNNPDIFVAKLSNSSSATGIKGENKPSLLTIYPNPAENYFTVEGENLQGVYIRSMEGKLIYQSGTFSNSYKISTENFPSGIYLLEVRTGNSREMRKIVIQH